MDMDEKINDTKENINENENVVNEEETAKGQAEPETYVLSKEEFNTVKEHIEKLEKENKETIVLAQRLQADFDNFRRRNSAVRADSLNEGVCDTIKALLPIVYNFERAVNSAQAAGVEGDWIEGFKLVQRQLIDELAKLGFEEIPAQGQTFDPLLHEAVMQENVDGIEPGTITQVLQKGYKVKDRIISHSIVKVAN